MNDGLNIKKTIVNTIAKKKSLLYANMVCYAVARAYLRNKTT